MTKPIWEATTIAALVAILALLLFILPAEYGIDATGFGGAIGITNLSDSHVDQTFANETFRVDEVTIVVPAQQGLEYKFLVTEGSGMVYSWNATSAMFFEFHGEPDATSYLSYKIETASESHGQFTAPFTGTHGWYWRNDGFEPVSITLRSAGYYDVKGLV